MNEYTIVGPTNLKPRAFKSRLMRSDSSVLDGTLPGAGAFTIGLKST